MKVLSQLLGLIRDDARGAVLYARSHWEAFQLSRKKKRDGKALLVAYREIGDRASESEEAKSRRSFGSVKEHEARLSEYETELAALKEKEATTRGELEERTRVREEELAALNEESSRRSRGHADAKRELRELEKEIDRAESRLEKPKEDDSPEELKARLTELRSGRPDREDAERHARSEAEEKAAEHRREKLAWAEEEERLEDALMDASRQAREGEVRREQARVMVAGSHEELGKSVVLAGFDEPGMKEPMDRAKDLLAAIRESDEGVRSRRVSAATVRTNATRFSAVWGGVLLLLVVVTGLAISANEKPGETRILPEQATASGTTTTDQPARPGTPSGNEPGSTGGALASTPDRSDSPAPAPGAPEPTADVTVSKFRAALLAHPTLRSVKPKGEFQILSRAPMAGGAERIDLKVPARRSGEEVRVVLRIVVDPDGRLLGVEHRGEETSEDDELMKLLEELE